MSALLEIRYTEFHRNHALARKACCRNGENEEATVAGGFFWVE
jgi:hypothetical protein